ncbi:MAG TPA: hypothetical protein VM843_07700 [Flavisolibacter sp.]|nr:hypothetical protein [Flavisolibacter sp.]
MKKILMVLISIALLQACNPSNKNPGESGTVNDGFDGAGDANGGLPDTMKTASPSIDTAMKGDQRVDTQQRDSLQ